MAQIIFDIFQFLTDVPFNMWPWLFLMLAPLLVFSAKPHHSARRRVGRIILAVAFGYVFINLTLHTHSALQWKEYEQCQKDNPVFGENVHPNCEGFINIADGASNVFYLVLGWIPAGGYVGFWELWWRIKHRVAIRAMDKQFKGKWFSTFVVVGAIPVWLFMFLIALFLIFMLTFCPTPVSTDKCWFPRHASPAP